MMVNVNEIFEVFCNLSGACGKVANCSKKLTDASIMDAASVISELQQLVMEMQNYNYQLAEDFADYEEESEVVVEESEVVNEPDSIDSTEEVNVIKPVVIGHIDIKPQTSEFEIGCMILEAIGEELAEGDTKIIVTNSIFDNTKDGKNTLFVSPYVFDVMIVTDEGEIYDYSKSLLVRKHEFQYPEVFKYLRDKGITKTKTSNGFVAQVVTLNIAE